MNEKRVIYIYSVYGCVCVYVRDSVFIVTLHNQCKRRVGVRGDTSMTFDRTQDAKLKLHSVSPVSLVSFKGKIL